jgi:undecaprenyl pyrophosphate synthase
MNVCIAYTSREEMTMAVRDICTGVEENKLEISYNQPQINLFIAYFQNKQQITVLIET